MRWTLVGHFVMVNNYFSDLRYIAMTVCGRAIISAGVAWCDAWEIEIVVVDLDVSEMQYGYYG